MELKLGDKLNCIGKGPLSSDNPYTVLYADARGALLRDTDNFTVWEEYEAIEATYILRKEAGVPKKPKQEQE